MSSQFAVDLSISVCHWNGGELRGTPDANYKVMAEKPNWFIANLGSQTLSLKIGGSLEKNSVVYLHVPNSSASPSFGSDLVTAAGRLGHNPANLRLRGTIEAAMKDVQPRTDTSSVFHVELLESPDKCLAPYEAYFYCFNTEDEKLLRYALAQIMMEPRQHYIVANNQALQGSLRKALTSIVSPFRDLHASGVFASLEEGLNTHYLGTPD